MLPGGLAGPARRPNHRTRVLLALLPFWLAACGGTNVQSSPEAVKVFASTATYPWLEGAYKCAPGSGAVVALAPRDAADIALQFGKPVGITVQAYQIGLDDLAVVVQPQTGVGPISVDQVRSLFSGQTSRWTSLGGADLPVQVWSYSSNEDVQSVFDREVMQGQPVVSLSRLAVTAQAMSDSVGATPGAIGLLPKRWKAGNTTTVYTLPSVPILAVTSSAPQRAVQSLVACMQSSQQ